MVVRRLAIASLVLSVALWAVPTALAQATTGSTEPAAGADNAKAEALESVQEKPAPKIPKRQAPKAETPAPQPPEIVDLSLLQPQDEVQARRQAALVSERKVQEQVELAKPSVHRSKVMRLDNQPHQKTRPIAIIKGTLGPWGYAQRYREGTAGTHKNQQNQNPAAAKAGQLGQGAGAPVVPLGSRNRRGGR